MRFNVRPSRHAQQTKFSLIFPCNLSYSNNSINPVTTVMNQAVI